MRRRDGQALCVKQAGMDSSLPHITTLRVRFGETDAAGIVFYPNVYVYFDVAGQELLRACGFAVGAKMRDEGVLLPIVESGARYFTPLLHDDEIAVAASVVHVGNSSLRVGYRIERGGEVTTEGFEVRVFARKTNNGIASERIPDDLRAALLERAVTR
jgi:4-hydroxybenzoyl-CoA thioesterase